MSKYLVTKFQESNLLSLPERFKNARIDEYTNRSLADIANHYLDNFSGFFDAGIAPSFFGSSGLGKSHIAAHIVRELHEDGLPAMWQDTVSTLTALMDHRDFRQISAYQELKRRLHTVPLLVLDDFGQLGLYRRTQELFFELVNARYSQKKSTIFTASFSVTGGDISTWTEVISAVGAPNVRRIRDMSKGLLFAKN